MAAAPDDWREIAWNGIRFRAPADWHPHEVGRRYLLLASPAGAAMELRWGPAGKTPPAPAAYLRRLRPRNAPRRIVGTTPPPKAWRKALSQFVSDGFSWSDGRQAATGVVLCCPVCRQATLMQFFHSPGSGPGPTAAAILADFRDHGTGRAVPFALFDLRAEIPDMFELAAHRFEAGYFQLEFRRPRQRLVLHRWGPAEVLLQAGGLAAVGRRLLPELDGQPAPLAVGPHQGLAWSHLPPVRGWRRWWERLRPGHRFRHYRIWHDKKRNRLMGVSLEGRLAPPHPWLEALCKAYESV